MYLAKRLPSRMNRGFSPIFAHRPGRSRSLALTLLLLSCIVVPGVLTAQDWVKTGTSLGVEKVRLAVPDFKPSTTDPQNAALLKTFNDTLWNDLDVSGVVELASKSFYPLQIPGQPPEVNFPAWNSPPPNAAMLAFGNLGVSGGKLTVQGWLYDVKNIQSPQVLGKQYGETATDAAARVMAHKFADEIIFRLGGGIPGIAESEIVFVSDRGGHKEIWAMDYDGSNQHQLDASGIDCALAANFAGQFSRRLQWPDQERVGHHDVLGRSQPHGELSALRRNESLSCLVERWGQAGVFVLTRWDARNLCCRRFRRQFAPPDRLQRSRRWAHVESQDERANFFCQRADGAAADLHHGSRRHQSAASDRSGVCGFSELGSEWTVFVFCVGKKIRPGGTRSIRYLSNGCCQQAVGATHARRRPERFSVMVAGWPAYCFSIKPCGQSADLVHAG